MKPASQVEVRVLRATREARRIRAELEKALHLTAQTMRHLLAVERELANEEARQGLEAPQRR
jgi:hypothetical protein